MKMEFLEWQSENKRQLTMPYGERNCKQHFLQAGISKNCDE
jgi:hypothetical protein